MSRFFIDRPIFANVIAIVIVLLGVVCLSVLPVAQYPNIVPPTIQVQATYTGASADVVAKTVGIPIEQAVNGVENSIYMQSTSGSDGSYTLTITFSVGSDLNTALALVQNAVNAAVPQLPQPVRAQGVNVRKVSTNILLIETLYSDDNRYDDVFLANYAVINLEYPIARLPGVGQVTVFGAGPYSMRVWLDPQRLKTFGLTVEDIQNAIQEQNIQVSAGRVGGEPSAPDQIFQFTVNALGRLSEVSEFEDIIVKSRPPPSLDVQSQRASLIAPTSQVVRLRDIAKVTLDQQVFTVFSTVNGKKAAHIAVFALPGANALEVAKETRALVAKMSKTFPEGLKYTSLYDTTVFINQSIEAVYETLIEAGVLVLLVIMVFLQNTRALLVPATTVPVTIIGAFIAMAALGFTINLMTLFALILAIGIVVDDAIVIVENTTHYIERGMTPKEATNKAMSELVGPIVGITLVLCSAFLPASFLPGITGQMFRQFALVIAATAVISALNALTLNPAQCALYLRARSGKPPNLLARGFNRAFQRIEDGYIWMVRHMVDRPKTMVVVFILLVGSAATGFAVYPTALLPLEDQGYGIIVTQLPKGASQPRVRDVAAQMDKALQGTPGVEGWVSIGGYSGLDSAKLSNVITTFIVFQDWSKRPKGADMMSILGDIRARLDPIREGFFSVLPPSPIPGLGTAFGFQMMIEDRGDHGLLPLSQSVNDVLQTAYSREGFLRTGFTTFTADNPQVYLDIDRTMARSYGVSIENIFGAVQTFIGSSFVNFFNKFNQNFQVKVQADADYRLNMPDIADYYVTNKQSQMVPLGALLSTHRILGSDLITRFNLYPAATLTGIPNPGFSSGEAITIMEKIGTQRLPAGFAYEWNGLAYQEKLLGDTIVWIFGLSIVLVFLVLSAQYESWADPAVVIVVVPVALVGIVTGLVIKRLPNDLYTQIGLVLMVALAAKNAILIVEFARELRHEGLSAKEAAIEATKRRFRAIVMTSLAFVLGVFPLVTADGAGAASQQSLGTVVFGGMLASTLLAIPFVSVFYVVVQTLIGRAEGHKPAHGSEGA